MYVCTSVMFVCLCVCVCLCVRRQVGQSASGSVSRQVGKQERMYAYTYGGMFVCLSVRLYVSTVVWMHACSFVAV